MRAKKMMKPNMRMALPTDSSDHDLDLLLPGETHEFVGDARLSDAETPTIALFPLPRCARSRAPVSFAIAARRPRCLRLVELRYETVPPPVHGLGCALRAAGGPRAE